MATAVLKGNAQRERTHRRFAFLRRILEIRLVGPSLIILLIVIVSALGAGILSPHDPAAQDYTAFTKGPSLSHPLGTDDLGRDVLARIIYGARISLQVGIIAVGIAVALGVTLGLLSGYTGGFVDDIIMRFVDAVQAFPTLVLALAITAALGPNVGNAMIAIGFVSTPAIARLTRGQTLSIREREYVEAARVLGANSSNVVFSEILPNTSHLILVAASLQVPAAIIVEAGLSFIGLGDPHPRSLGLILSDAYPLLRRAWWTAVFPGLALSLISLSFNLTGDGLNDALNPRLKD